MSTDLYRVTVLDKPEDDTIDIEVKVLAADSMLIEPFPGFALMVLRDFSSPKNLLIDEVSIGSVMKAEWARYYVRGFIVGVELIKEENKPSQEVLDDHSFKHPYYKDPKNWLKGVLRITVTHPAWIGHLNIGDSWNSAAFDPIGIDDYRYCEPVFPHQEEAKLSGTVIDYSEGFFPVNKYILDKNNDIAPNIPLMYPCYDEESYIAVDKLTKEDGITEEKIKKWVGRPIKFRKPWRVGCGILVPGIGIVTTTGYEGIFVEDLEWIGLAALNSRKPKYTVVHSDYNNFIKTDPVVSAVEINSTFAFFNITALHSDYVPKEGTNAYYFDLFKDFHFGFNKKLYDILKKLEKDGEYSSQRQLYTNVANAFIVNSKFERSNEGIFLNDESLSPEERIRVIEEENFPVWRLTIEVSDPCWITHLIEGPSFKQSRVLFYYGHQTETRPWKGALITEKDLE